MFYRYVAYVFLFLSVFALGAGSVTSFAAAIPVPTRTKTATQIPATATLSMPTAVTKTEIVVFDNVTIEAGQKVISGVYDVSNYKEVTMYLSSKPEPYNIATCYFVPTNAAPTDRYKGLTISAQTGSGPVLPQVGASGKVMGPRMVCEIVNQILGSTASLSLYLIP